MKKAIIFIILIATSSFGYVLESAEPIFQKQFSLQLNTVLNAKWGYNFMGVFGIGIASGYNLLAKFGYVAGSDNEETPYVGLENKILVASFFGGTDNVSFNLGGHMQQKKDITLNKTEFKPGVDVTLNSSNKFSIFHFYTGFDANIELYKEIEYPVNLFIGTRVQLKRMNLIFEFDLPVTSDALYNFCAATMIIL